ncbi:MAG TPA: hypothetical protein VNJ47_07760 [Nevskiales bacterium]|nr:hypothetical protein [Nevskiales bacterium]
MTEPGWLYGAVLIFTLGLRHGLDPDHIAVIDGLVYRQARLRPRLAPWVGTLFALGHGLAVTAVAVTVAWLTDLGPWRALDRPVFELLPIGLLLVLGTLNLLALLRTQHYQPLGWKTRLMPQRWRQAAHPAGIVGTGMVFALVFDTVTQVAAWGTVAALQAGPLSALVIGLVFTAGMMITDTLDSRLLARLLRASGAERQRRRYRRAVGWLMVVLSYGFAGYALARLLWPRLELSDAGETLAGILCALLVLLAGFGLDRGRLRAS